MFSSWDTCAAGNCTEAEVAFSIIKWEWEREETTNSKFSTLLLSLLSLSLCLFLGKGEFAGISACVGLFLGLRRAHIV